MARNVKQLNQQSASFYSETISNEIKELVHIGEVIQTITEDIRESIMTVISSIKRLGNRVDAIETFQNAFNELENQAAERQLTLDVTTSLRLEKCDVLKNNLNLPYNSAQYISDMFEEVSKCINILDIQFHVNWQEIHNKLAREMQTE